MTKSLCCLLQGSHLPPNRAPLFSFFSLKMARSDYNQLWKNQINPFRKKTREISKSLCICSLQVPVLQLCNLITGVVISAMFTCYICEQRSDVDFGLMLSGASFSLIVFSDPLLQRSINIICILINMTIFTTGLNSISFCSTGLFNFRLPS